MPGTYLLDGLPLDDVSGRWWLRNGTGVRILPARRRTEMVLPGVPGQVPDPGAVHESGTVSLLLFVQGSTYQQFRLNLELLMGVLGQYKTMTLTDQYGDTPGANDRFATVELMSNVEPEMKTPRSCELNAVFSVPGVFWRSLATSDSSLAVTTTPTSGFLTNLDGGTAPIFDGLIRVKGAFSVLTVKDNQSGDQLIVNRALTSTQYIIVDTTNWTARQVSTNTWTGGTVVDTDVISNKGSGSMMRLLPTFASGSGRYSVTVSATSAASSPTFEVRAKKAYL